MKKIKKRSPEKMMSFIITGALVCALAVGVISVAGRAKKGSSNIVDLNETKIEQAKAEENTLKDSVTDYTRSITITDQADTLTKAAGDVKSDMQEKSDIPTKASDTDTSGPDTAHQGNNGVAANSADNIAAKYSFGENDTLKRPVNGEVIMKYSMDSTIYYKTLGLYKVNPAVNIAASAGTEVIAAASGVANAINVSDETGTTVSIAIGNNYVTTYGLLDDVKLKKGMTVVAGDVIGKVAEPTRYYTEEGANLYFKLTVDDKPVDPVAYFE